MLRQRILTALILLPIFILLVLKLAPQTFCFFTGALVFWAAFEWAGLMGLNNVLPKLFYALIIVGALFVSLWLRIPNVMYVAAIWWIFASSLVFLYPRHSDAWGNSVIVRGVMGGFVLVPCWLAINFIRTLPDGSYTLLFLFALIWSADSGAYFFGKKWGENKIAPEVSPGKSWEGFWGGILMALTVTLIALYWTDQPTNDWLGIITVALVTVVFSVMGDLFESMLKRKVGVKDSGRLLPGHGGMLDRIDSLTAAAPIFVVGSIFLQKLTH